ncbi:MAG: mechanosensitive ion channel family protein [Euryarchaeota archaeon]|nr:mechanosensitive ion channel family protein [Euryarchaeota archaeon]
MIEFNEIIEGIQSETVFGHTLSSWMLSLILLILGLVLAKLFSRIALKWSKKRLDKHGQNILKKIVSYLVIIIFTMEALRNLGLDFSGVLVAGGILGIVLGFASQTVVSNLISGVFMYFDKPLKIGDYVVVEDISGVVMEIEILSTRIRTWDGNLIRIPNEKLFNSIIENRVSNAVRRIEVSVGIAYKEDINKAIESIKNVLDEYPYVLVEPTPLIYVDELGDSSVNINIRVWSPNEYALKTKWGLLKPIKEALDREGIEIPFPQQDVHIRKEQE